MRHTAGLTAVVSLLACAPWALAQSPNLLWYEQPATDWEKEALPIGNGRIGAMVFGGVESERIQVAEKSLWTGGPGTEGGYDYGLPRVRGSSRKQWPNNWAARCTTTAIPRASVT